MYQGNIMKKVFFVVVTVAIMALAVVNLNLVLNNESKVNLELTSILAVAQNEDGGEGKCYKSTSEEEIVGCLIFFSYHCINGDEPSCYYGFSHWDFCTIEHLYASGMTLTCR